MKKCLHDKTRLFAWMLAVLFVLSLIPILLISFYNHPSHDDYPFSLGVHMAYENGEGILGMLRAAAAESAYFYKTWQGTFVAIFLFALQPGATSESLYFLSTFIMLGALIGSTFFLMHTILVKWLKQRKAHVVILSILILIPQIQFLPKISEAFFWFNGSVYYTFFYALSVVLLGVIIRMILAEKVRVQNELILLGALIAFLIGGGNFSTALFVACGFAFLIVLLLLKKHPVWKHLLLPFGAFAVAFAISVLAPGNAVRGSLYETMNPIRAVVESLFRALTYVGEWTTVGVLVVLVMAAPLTWKAAERCNWTFRWPLLVFIIAFGFYACLLTPPLYAMGSVGGGRQIDLYYYTYIMMLIFDVFYLCGWISKRHPSLICGADVSFMARKYILPGMIIFAVLFTGDCMHRGSLYVTSSACIKYLIDGTAKQHYQVVEEQLDQMRNTDGPCVITTTPPYVRVFTYYGLTEDPETLLNASYAQYYGCESVVYLPAEE